MSKHIIAQRALLSCTTHNQLRNIRVSCRSKCRRVLSRMQGNQIHQSATAHQHKKSPLIVLLIMVGSALSCLKKRRASPIKTPYPNNPSRLHRCSPDNTHPTPFLYFSRRTTTTTVIDCNYLPALTRTARGVSIPLFLLHTLPFQTKSEPSFFFYDGFLFSSCNSTLPPPPVTHTHTTRPLPGPWRTTERCCCC